MKARNIEEKDLSRLIISDAAQIAAMLLDYIGKRSYLHQASMTTIAYATQMIINQASQNGAGDYDDISKKYRDFLEQVQADVDNMVRSMNKDVN